MPARPTRSSCRPISATTTTFDEAIGAFAQAYAKQTEADHGTLLKAIKDGRLPTADQDS